MPIVERRLRQQPPSEQPAEQPSPSGATFIQMLKRRVTESHRFGVPLSVMYLKIEEYDIVNRKYGSPIARQMVDTAVPALKKTLREMDVLAKLENGEFVVMLPGSTQTEADHVAKRMRTATANCVLPLVDRELQIRLQHGIAELKPNETAQELIGPRTAKLSQHASSASSQRLTHWQRRACIGPLLARMV